MLVVKTPQRHESGRDYILDVILGEFLGLSWRREVVNRQDVCITFEDQPGEVLLPDKLFSVSDTDWLQSSSMPRQPLQKWDTTELGLDIVLVESSVPVLYGEDEPRGRREFKTIRLPLDIFGSAFFMLNRYEEMVILNRDEHDRFPAWASLAYQEGFLERPIIDEYVEILWAVMKALWPRLERKARTGRMVVTCDVDNPYAAYTKTWTSTLRKTSGDLLKRRSLSQAYKTLLNTKATTRGNYRFDPLDTFDWIMDVNENAGNCVIFYFLCDFKVGSFGTHYSLDEPRIRQLLRRIHERGHEIGLHGGFGTFSNKIQMAQEAQVLRSAMDQEGIQQEHFGNRQHYLSWNTPTTAHVIEHAGIQYDSTLAFADRPGFRCGTCHKYPFFDCTTRQKLSFWEHPLVAMECSVIDIPYLGLGYTKDSLALFQTLKERSLLVKGNFVLLWHNSHFKCNADEMFYKTIIE